MSQTKPTSPDVAFAGGAAGSRSPGPGPPGRPESRALPGCGRRADQCTHGTAAPCPGATRALAWSLLFVLNGDTGCGRGRGQREVDRSQTAFFPLRRRPVTPLSIPQGTKEGARLGAGGPLRPLWLGTGSQSTPSPEEFLAEFPTRLVAVFILRNEASPCARTYRCRQDRQVEDGAEAGLPGRTGQTAMQLCPCAGPLPRVRVAASVTRVAVYPSFSASLYLGIDHVCSCTCLSPWPAV